MLNLDFTFDIYLKFYKKLKPNDKGIILFGKIKTIQKLLYVIRLQLKLSFYQHITLLIFDNALYLQLSYNKISINNSNFNYQAL